MDIYLGLFFVWLISRHVKEAGRGERYMPMKEGGKL
jgi:hypothetical protein